MVNYAENEYFRNALKARPACGFPAVLPVGVHRRFITRKEPGKRALTIPCSNPQAGGGGGGRQSGPRLPKMPQMQDFQFFNTARLTEIYNKENAHEVHKHQQGQKEASLRSQVRLPVFQTFCEAPGHAHVVLQCHFMLHCPSSMCAHMLPAVLAVDARHSP
jgi:HAND